MTQSNQSLDISKRTFLGAMAALTAVGVSPTILAADGGVHGKHTAYPKKLVATAEECSNVGQACKAHIYGVMTSGDDSLNKCLLLVRDTIAACDTLVELVTNGSSHSKHMAGVCAGICKDCEAECIKHAKKHAICKTMADSCKATVAACKKYIG